MTKPVNTLPRLYSSRKAKKSAKAHKSAKVTDTLKHSNRPKALKLAEARGFISHIFFGFKSNRILLFNQYMFCTTRLLCARCAVELLHNWVRNRLELLLHLLVLFRHLLRRIQPRDRVIHRTLELGLIRHVELVLQLVIVEGVSEVVCIRLEAVLGLDARCRFLVLLVFLGLVDYALDLRLRETALVIGNGDMARLAG